MHRKLDDTKRIPLGNTVNKTNFKTIVYDWFISPNGLTLSVGFGTLSQVAGQVARDSQSLFSPLVCINQSISYGKYLTELMVQIWRLNL